MNIPQVNTSSIPKTTPKALPAPTDASTPPEVRDGVSLQGPPIGELLQDLHKLRGIFADKQQSLVQQREAHAHVSHDLLEEANALGSYEDNLKLFGPAFKSMGAAAKDGKLEEWRKIGQDLASHEQGDFLQSLALSTKRNMGAIFQKPEDQLSDEQWNAATILRITGAMGDDPAQQAAQIDKVLENELFITHERRMQFHPEPFLEGTVDAAKLDGLGDWMITNAANVNQQAEAKAKVATTEWKEVEHIQEQMNENWQSRKDPEKFAARKQAAREFLEKLQLADQQHPGILKEMKSRCEAEIGLKPYYFPDSVLGSYQAQLKRSGGDVEKIDWIKLLKQLERTSLG